MTINSQYIPDNKKITRPVYKMDSIMIPRSRVIELLGPSIKAENCDDFWSGVIKFDGFSFSVACWFRKGAFSLTLWSESLSGHDKFKQLLEG
jgi:hypothetical protein